MHIEGPWLSTTGRPKRKQKFRNAKQANVSRQLDEEWKKLNEKWNAVSKKATPKTETLQYKLSTPPGRETKYVPSRDTGHLGTISSKETPKYTGNAVIGISQMAKSNAVPVFNTDHIVEIGKMRR